MHTYIHTHTIHTMTQTSVTLLDKHPSLLSAVASMARTCVTLSRQDYAYTAQFNAPDKPGSKVTLGHDNRVCVFHPDSKATVFAGTVIMPDTGLHYIEYEMLKNRYVM